MELVASFLLCCLVLSAGGHKRGETYFPDWSHIEGRPTQPTCVDIPRNMTLCHDIGYNKMRLPNLLDHDTMAEVSQQAASWVPLLNVQCNPDTKLFLCSLFSPVCLDRPIYPCRSLCEQVKQGCESRMTTYGYPWPSMLMCDKFPLDNDMCIMAQSGGHTQEAGSCQACNQVETYENILDNFCRADFAVRTKIRRVRKTKLVCYKARVFKTGGREWMKRLRRPVFVLDAGDGCCRNKTKNSPDNYLIMGQRRGRDLVPTFIMPWSKRSKPFKKAVRMFKRLDCKDPKVLTMMTDATGTSDPGRRRRGKNRNRRKNGARGRQSPSQPTKDKSAS